MALTRRRPRVKRVPAERLRAYSTDFPLSEDGHDYLVKSIPRDLWHAVSERAVVEQRSLRWILLTLLERYRKGAITL